MKLPRVLRLSLFIGLFLLMLMSLFRLGLYLYFPAPEGAHSAITGAFVLGLRYDLRDVCILILPFLILGSFRKLSPFDSVRARRGWLFYFVFFSIILLFFYVFDFSYFAYLQQRLNAQVLNFLEDASISFNMMWQSYPIIKLLIFIGVAAWVCAKFYQYLFRKISNYTPVLTRWKKVVFFIAGFLVMGLGIFGRIGQYPLRWSDAFSFGDDYLAAVSLNPFQSFFSSLKFRSTSFDAARTRKYYHEMAALLGVDQPDSSKLNFERKVHDTTSFLSFTQTPNVVVVICESFAAYKSSMWGNPLNTTPFFADMCRNGYFFDHCFTAQWGTARGVWATITGIPDVQEGPTASRNPLAVDQHTIISDFKGYDKFYFLGGSTTWANIRGLLKNNIEGLKIYEQEDFAAEKVDVWGVSDKNLFLEANKILAHQQKPFFAVIQTADNHRPFTIPQEDLAEFKKLDISKDSLHQYGFSDLAEFNAFRYTDFCYKKFITAAQQEKYFSNTLFVFVGDHGNPGNASANFPDAWTKYGLVYTHVPLLFYAPGRLPARRSATLCSQQDILASVASLCKISYRNTTMGRNLFSLDTMKNKNDFSFIQANTNGGYSIIQNDLYYRFDKAGRRTTFCSIVNNQPVPVNNYTDSLKRAMSSRAEACFETARYMLYNNKKK